jgi:hypothetical protein
VSYGVNRARKRTTRRKKRQSSSGRARAAAKGRSRATSTRRATSARSVRRKSGRKVARKTSRSTRKRTTSTRAKKARLYTRYDPETGQKVRVTADTFEYANWVSRKPSKKKIQRAALKADPLGTIGQVGLAAGTRAAEKIAERGVRTVARKYGVAGAAAAAEGAAALGYGSVALAALPIAAALGGALYYYSLQPGAEENKLSLSFVAAQKTLMQQTHAATWTDVPEQARNRLLNEYKAGLKRIAEVRRATSLQTSNRYRKG